MICRVVTDGVQCICGLTQEKLEAEGVGARENCFLCHHAFGFHPAAPPAAAAAAAASRDVFRVAVTLDNTNGFMTLRRRVIGLAEGASWAFGDSEALSYGRTDDTRLHLSVRFYFHSLDSATRFIHRLDQSLPPAVLPTAPMLVDPSLAPATLIPVQRSMIGGGFFMPTPRDECQTPLDGPASDSGRTVCGEDADCEAISDPRLIGEGVKLEQCHIRSGLPAVPYNRIVCQRNLHAYFDGLPTMTTWDRRTVFLSMGDAIPRPVVGREDRIFVQLRVHFLYPELQMRHVFLHESRLDDPSLTPTLSHDRRTFTCWVGFKRHIDSNGRPDDDATALAQISANVAHRLPPAEWDPTPPEPVHDSIAPDSPRSCTEEE